MNWTKCSSIEFAWGGASPAVQSSELTKVGFKTNTSFGELGSAFADASLTTALRYWPTPHFHILDTGAKPLVDDGNY